MQRYFPQVNQGAVSTCGILPPTLYHSLPMLTAIHYQVWSCLGFVILSANPLFYSHRKTHTAVCFWYGGDESEHILDEMGVEGNVAKRLSKATASAS